MCRLIPRYLPRSARFWTSGWRCEQCSNNTRTKLQYLPSLSCLMRRLDGDTCTAACGFLDYHSNKAAAHRVGISAAAHDFLDLHVGANRSSFDDSMRWGNAQGCTTTNAAERQQRKIRSRVLQQKKNGNQPWYQCWDLWSIWSTLYSTAFSVVPLTTYYEARE
jgi:hypothetical protein